jgi:citrate lyase subunit beta/citryl-CoA lyase
MTAPDSPMPQTAAPEPLIYSRSLLFVPGDRPERMGKAVTSGADAVILDLEDSVAPGRKAFAREAVREFLAGRTAAEVDLIVRINPLDGIDWRLDLDLVNDGQPAAVMLPKSAGSASVIELLHVLRADIPVLPIAAETPASIFALGSYADVANRLCGITWGAEDLAASLGASASRSKDGALLSPLETARSLTLLAARAAGTAAIETVYTKVHDLEGLTAAASRAASEGFTGMMAIHPSQIQVINAAFSPTDAQLAEAEGIVRLFANDPGAGVVVRNDRMVDLPHLKHAQAIIARARRIRS